MPSLDISLPLDSPDPPRDDSLVNSPFDLMPAVSDGAQAHAGDHLMDYVSRHPLPAVLVSAAAGAGTMALMMLGTRSSSRTPDHRVAASPGTRSQPGWLPVVAGVLAAWLTPRVKRKDAADSGPHPH